MYKAKTRMVSFRLSEDEYERLKDLSLTECARSVSDFARAALCRLPAGSPPADGPGPRVDRLEGTVRQLKFELFELRQLVETLLDRGPASAEPPQRPQAAG